MYNREILESRVSPIENGEAVQGTWDRAFDEVHLLEIRRPYRYPLPRWVINFRLKEWTSFCVQDERLLLNAFFSNVKLFSLAQVFLYDKKTGEKSLFRKFLPIYGWQLPRSLANTSTSSGSSGFFFRIHNWLDADTIKLDLDIKAKGRRPALTAHLAYNMNRRDTIPMAVSLAFAERRPLYAFKALSPVRGDIIINGNRISLAPETCSGLFCDYKGFFPYPMRQQICNASGFDAEGRRFGFHIAENQTRETFKNNENALWLNGQLTPLPPVRITMPMGPDSDWIIQDVEGMVDLVFTPMVPNRSGVPLIVINGELNAPLGQYNGMLVTSGGERIQVRSLFGMGEKLFLQV